MSTVKVWEPSAGLLEANYLTALARLVKRSQPIRDYYARLLKWDGGCALPDDPSKGEQTDFVEALDAFKDADEARQKAKR